MPQLQEVKSEKHSEVIDNTTYEIVSNYVGNIPLVELFKQMIKRDAEKTQ